MKTPLPVFLALALLIPALPRHSRADDKPAPRRIAVVTSPLNGHFPAPASDAVTLPKRYPAIANPIADCLPGRMWDISTFLQPKDWNPAAGDFIWFNPESNLVIIRAPGDKVDLAKAAIEAVYPLDRLNVVADSSVSIGGDADGKDAQSDLMRWRIASVGGQRATSSAAGAKSMAYSFEFEPKLSVDRKSCDVDLVVKVMGPSGEYSTTTKVTTAIGEIQNIKLGTTPEGKTVWLHLAITTRLAGPPPSFKDESAYPGLVGRIEKSLAKPK